MLKRILLVAFLLSLPVAAGCSHHCHHRHRC